MKKSAPYLMILLMMLSLFPAQLRAETGSMEEAKEVELAEAKVLLTRLDEINAMDRAVMSRSEKRQLRKEVKEIKTKTAKLSGGVYLSAGAIVIALLLLILLL